MSSAMPYKIDTHSHFLPPFYRQACIDNGHGKNILIFSILRKCVNFMSANPDGMPYLPEWSPEAHLELMEKHNIKKSILSISSPGTHLVPRNNKLAAKLSRACNQYAADLKKRMPDRFGYFASLPIPDVETCLREIDLALDEGCDGFVIETNGHGIYPGDSILDPVFDELNRRQATVFFHPTTPTCPCSPEAIAAGQQPVEAAPFAGRYPNPMLEFLFDTTRTIVHLFLSGTVKRCPKIQFIFSHLGGTMPAVLSRFSEYANFVPVPWTKTSEEEVRDAFKKQVWFDLAGFAFPGQIQGLLAAGGQTDKLLCGR